MFSPKTESVHTFAGLETPARFDVAFFSMSVLPHPDLPIHSSSPHLVPLPITITNRHNLKIQPLIRLRPSAHKRPKPPARTAYIIEQHSIAASLRHIQIPSAGTPLHLRHARPVDTSFAGAVTAFQTEEHLAPAAALVRVDAHHAAEAADCERAVAADAQAGQHASKAGAPGCTNSAARWRGGQAFYWSVAGAGEVEGGEKVVGGGDEVRAVSCEGERGWSDDGFGVWVDERVGCHGPDGVGEGVVELQGMVLVADEVEGC